MGIFSKKIETRVDYVAVFDKALSDAVANARKGGIGAGMLMSRPSGQRKGCDGRHIMRPSGDKVRLATRSRSMKSLVPERKSPANQSGRVAQMSKKQTNETPPTLDRTVQREMFRADLSAAVTKATALCGLSRAQTISDMLHFANELCEAADADGEDLSPLQGLLS